MGDDIFSYNGSAMLAMRGANCVCIAADTRFAKQHQTLATDYQKIIKMNARLFVGLAGLATDAQTLANVFELRQSIFKLRQNREMTPSLFAKVCSSLLYEKRFGPYFAVPIIAGLEPDGTSYVATMDSIGALAGGDDFVVGGTAEEFLYGVCETFYKPDMDSDTLTEVVSQCLLAGMNRDAFSGWGAVVHTITPEGVSTRTLRTRQD